MEVIMKLKTALFTVLLLGISSLFAAWFDSDWTYRKMITLDKDKVVNSTQIDFPVLIDFTDPGLIGKVQTAGWDILFTAADGITKLDHQLESINSSTGHVTAWVRIPSLSHQTDTVIYFYYGNAAAANQQNSASVWDAGYEAVWHLNDENNSTGSFHNGTPQNGVSFATAGIAGPAASFDGTDDYIDFGDILDMGLTDRSASAWFKTTSAVGAIFGKSLLGQVVGRWTLIYEGGSLYSIFQGIAGEGNWELIQWDTPDNFADGNWHNVTIVYDRSGYMKAYVDGVFSQQIDISAAVAVDMQSDHHFYIGRYQDTSGTGPHASFIFNGLIDEVRISSTIRSADWIATEYNNQSSPQTFIKTVGPETLPVELSSFTAIVYGNMQVRLQWITQSETNVLGFYIYRNTSADLESALQVSPLISATNSSQQMVYIYNDRDVSEGTYAYWLENVDFNGDSQIYGPIYANVESNPGNFAPEIPLANRLGNAYPNPFEVNTTIKYGLEKSATVRIEIFNTKGQLVRSYQDLKSQGGNYTLDWDAKDMQGNNVNSGVYLYRMTVDGFSSTKKVILLK
jgi:hypothetical protein